MGVTIINAERVSGATGIIVEGGAAARSRSLLSRYVFTLFHKLAPVLTASFEAFKLVYKTANAVW